jgi:hypothetical protein
MSFLRDLKRECLRTIGFDGDEPIRRILDVFLGALAAFSSHVLVAFAFEKDPSETLRKTAIIGAVVVVGALLSSKNRLGVALGIVAVIGIRGAVAVALYGYKPGLLLALGAAIVVFLGIRWAAGRKG